MRYVMLGVAALISGVISGMGIGGGAVLIPALAVLFGMRQHEAQAINLIYFLPTAATALISHIKSRSVDGKIWLPIVIAGLPCAVIGAVLAARTDAALLRKAFGFFLLAVGVGEFFSKGK